MEQTKNEKLMACTNLDELINVEYGEPGTELRRQFDEETQAFCLAQTLKEERLRAGLTQKQLAEKVGIKRTYISRIENGKVNVQLSTLSRLFKGLGKRIYLSVL
jgi:DNA-binding XRE family transcriptional regulator